jgi:RNA-directed DNA polymerase
VAAGREVRRRVAPKALEVMKQWVRTITTRNRGQRMTSLFAKLRSYLEGWKEYFRPARTPGIFRELDEWLRHRLRMVQLKQWKRGRAVCREMKRLGWWLRTHDASGAASRNCSRPLCPRGTMTAWGCHGLRGDLDLPNRRLRTRMSGGVGGG